MLDLIAIHPYLAAGLGLMLIVGVILLCAGILGLSKPRPNRRLSEKEWERLAGLIR